MRIAGERGSVSGVEGSTRGFGWKELEDVVLDDIDGFRYGALVG